MPSLDAWKEICHQVGGGDFEAWARPPRIAHNIMEQVVGHSKYNYTEKADNTGPESSPLGILDTDGNLSLFGHYLTDAGIW